jgi:xanthine dehydrogenase accessory factor
MTAAAQACDASGAPVKVLVKGAGEHATATAHRLHRCGMRVVMTEIEAPTAVRLSVSYCTAVWDSAFTVEGVRSVRWSLDDAPLLDGFTFDHIPLFVDPAAHVRHVFRPDVIVDARIAKRNVDNRLDDAPLVVGLGPGLLAGRDVHVVVETNRGHHLGRLLYEGEASPDTGIPGKIEGFGVERVLRAPVAGVVRPALSIGTVVEAGALVCTVDGLPVWAGMPGLLRGLVRAGLHVPAGLKIGDIDPRHDPIHCTTLSDKARTLSGAVLEAILSTPWSTRP